MTHAANLNAFHQCHAEFFLQFPRECNLRRFAVLDLSTGEFPLERGGIVFPALADEQSPVAALNHRRDDSPHARSRIRSSGWKSLQSARAPSTSEGPGVLSTSSLSTSTLLFRIAGTSFHPAT